MNERVKRQGFGLGLALALVLTVGSAIPALRAADAAVGSGAPGAAGSQVAGGSPEGSDAMDTGATDGGTGSTNSEAAGSTGTAEPSDRERVASGSGQAQNDVPKKEVVYARLQSDGAVKDIYVVNMLAPESPGLVTDYGAYSKVLNLEQPGDLAYQEGAVSIQVGKEGFSYQGNLSSRDLPWEISLEYRLDGIKVSPQDLAGKSGKLALSLNIRQNKQVDPSFFENYLLQTTVVFDGRSARDIAAPEGQIALAGSDTQVTFTTMPGKASSFEVAANVSNFEMQGISFAAVPFSMAIESPDITGFNESLGKLSSGVGDLDAGVSSLSSGAATVATGAGQLQGGLAGVGQGMNSLSAGAGQLAVSSGQIKQGLEALALAGSSLSGGSSQMDAGLQGLSQSAVVLQSLMADPGFQAYLTGLAASDPTLYASYSQALGTLAQGLPALSAQYSSFDAGLQAYLDSVDALAGQYGAFNDGVSGIASGAKSLAEGTSQLTGSLPALVNGIQVLAEGAGQLSAGTHSLYAETQGMPDTVRAEIDKMMAEYDKSAFEPVSFVSPLNTKVLLVQFILQTDPIKLPEPEKVPAPSTEGNAWARLMALFGL
ncbi:MAG: hypothetical protein LBG81_06795 [Coriobacteriaceae bacterium]|nr:hypothetical protein [Coriobacteriaceae bacterium]